MTIGISPLVPTSLDRNDDRAINPRQPKIQKPADKESIKPLPPDKDKLDAIEDSVPPLPPNK